MLYSNLFGKTKKEAPKDEVSLNAKLLIRGGFVQKEMAGVYAFLPLGLRVVKKIEQIIREEMEAIGGQELILAALQNPEIWKKTNRWGDDVIDVWFKTQLQGGSEIGLATTHEEPLTQIVTHYVTSYRDLPLYLFQFQTKFRNEMRAKSGLLRTREFVMKDLYSFNRTVEEQEDFYEQAKKAYLRVFERIGLGDITFVTFASGKPFSKYSHEFQTLSKVGEDTIYLSREKNLAVNKEVYTDEVLAELDLDKSELEEVAAVEVGNIFKLGTKYSEALGLFYTDEAGERRSVVMGSYGVGPARAMATVVETFHDDKGILWPESVAPFKVHLVGLGLDDAAVKDKAFEIYEKLLAAGVEVLFDDRADVSAGEKFADSDLIGIPYRLVVSSKTGDKVGVKKRNEDVEEIVSVREFLKIIS